MPEKFKNIQGYFDFPHIYEALAKQFPQGKFVELGSWLGKSTCFMAEFIKENNLGLKFYTVDTFLGEIGATDQQVIVKEEGGSIYKAFLKNMSNAGVLDYVTPLKLTSEEASKIFPDKSLDAVFLDASHLFGDVWADLTNWVPKIKNGGILGSHDYYITDKPTEVKLAIDKFFNNKGQQYNNCFIIQL
jgi:predicted O-methyltransferase YrrM